ncbi:MAG TPA: LysR substrate-binding domain-containing protein [Terriglobia bacterium]|nr:LysR substrate-binding domain-containing protein [Terriglobia bacterium]
MELRHLRYFTTVAEELHFGRAAARLHIAQPPLSQQIRRLEEELGVQLFERTRRRVQLTHAGQTFLEEARRTLAQAEQAVCAARKAAQGEVGQLAIGFVDSAVYQALPPTLRLFRERFPRVELVLRELGPAAQFQLLREGQLHAGFVRSRVDDPALAQIRLFEEPLMAALPSRHPGAGRESVCLRDLARDPFVIFPRALGTGFYDQIVSLCGQAGFSPHVVQEANEMQTIVSLVAAGIGVAIVPASISNLRMKGVSYVHISRPLARTAMTVAWRRDDASPALKAFLQIIHRLSRESHRFASPRRVRR